MALEGTLEDFSLADIFQLIGIQRKTGVLTLKRADETVSVKFHSGMVIGADSVPKKLEDRLGKVLVKTGLITPEQLKEALEYQQKTLQKIGFVLIDQKYISREELKEALQIQIAQMIYRLFRWHSGEYYFDQKAKVDPNSDESIAPMSAESILMEGIQMIDEWPLIEKRIPNFNMVFKPSVSPDELDLSGNPEDELDSIFNGSGGDHDTDKIRLSREEAEIFRLIDGKNSVADVVESSKQGEFYTCKALYDLLERKLIEPVAMAAAAVARQQASKEDEREEELLSFLKPEKKTINPLFVYPVLAAVVLVLLFVRWKDPLMMTPWKFFRDDVTSQMKTGVNAGRIHLVDSTILMYYYSNGQLPESLDTLVSKNYLKEEDILDPWSRPYFYETSGNSYMLEAFTKDGRLDQNLKFQRTLTALQELPQQKGATEDAIIRLEN